MPAIRKLIISNLTVEGKRPRTEYGHGVYKHLSTDSQNGALSASVAQKHIGFRCAILSLFVN